MQLLGTKEYIFVEIFRRQYSLSIFKVNSLVESILVRFWSCTSQQFSKMYFLLSHTKNVY